LKAAEAEENAKEFRRQARPDLAALADYWHAFYMRGRRQFVETHSRDLVGAFRALQDAGHIEILTSAATHCYLPLLGTDAAVSAQVRQGAASYRRHFGRDPRGFWLPECAYRPRYHWQPPVQSFQTPEPTLRRGVEEFLADEGIGYFFVDAHLLRGGKAIGVYADRFQALDQLWSQFTKEISPQETERSPHLPYMVNSSGKPMAAVAAFARDPQTGVQVWSGDIGYPGDPWYLEFHKKHYPGGLRYWRLSWPRDDLGSKEVYEPVRALSRLPDHARHFAGVVRKTLEESRISDGRAIVTSMYDTELFGHWWFEGAEWLYYAIRELAQDPDIQRTTCGGYLDQNSPKEVVALPEGSWGEGGYHWIWLNERTSWTWENIYACEREMTALTVEFGDEARVEPILKQAARELLLLQSSDWQFSISTWASADYATQRVNFHADRFMALAGLARRAAAGEEIPEEQWGVLAEAEARDRCFPDVDPAWWAAPEGEAS
jgi:1,4-alpha-glucan branching enzyme